MAIETVDLGEAQERLPELLSKAAAGTEIIISEGGTPRARLVPVDVRPEPRKPRIPGMHRGAITFISDDFDAPLPDSFWLGEEDNQQ